jgi:nucleoid-associated protein YgaU
MPGDIKVTAAAPAPTKLLIVAYSDPQFKQETDSYAVQINPEKYSQTFKIEYDTQAASGAANTPAKFARIPPTEMKFELIFDTTGVVDSKTTDLAKEIDKFKTVVYRYDGEIHEPRYLGLFWGKLRFGARLTSLTFTYTLFAPTGEALRAKADTTFMGYEDAVTASRRADQQSPDITHQVVTQAGDNLPALTQRIYGDTRYVREVARHNRLVNFRHLPSGLTLTFPPLD